MVVVIVIVGVLALAVIPRFVGKVGFDARGFFDETQSMLRYGQKVAVAQHTNVFVRLNAGTLELCYDAGCAAPVLNPADQAAFSKTAPSGVNIASTAASFSFDPLGKPNPDAAVTFTISAAGEPIRTVTIERETGYVHP
jgi:MSHA pilin protein MshC